MFTQPCFIRKNTPELRKKLEELGYRKNANICKNYPYDYGNKDLWIGVNTVEYFTFRPHYNSRFDIDCGTNEALFLALAALRDDSDKDQLFTNGHKWCWSRFSKGFHTNGWHKATPAELIEHFKK